MDTYSFNMCKGLMLSWMELVDETHTSLISAYDAGRT
jgi:hypothetical protein